MSYKSFESLACMYRPGHILWKQVPIHVKQRYGFPIYDHGVDTAKLSYNYRTGQSDIVELGQVKSGYKNTSITYHFITGLLHVYVLGKCPTDVTTFVLFHQIPRKPSKYLERFIQYGQYKGIIPRNIHFIRMIDQIPKTISCPIRPSTQVCIHIVPVSIVARYILCACILFRVLHTYGQHVRIYHTNTKLYKQALQVVGLSPEDERIRTSGIYTVLICFDPMSTETVYYEDLQKPSWFHLFRWAFLPIRTTSICSDLCLLSNNIYSHWFIHYGTMFKYHTKPLKQPLWRIVQALCVRNHIPYAL